MCTQGCAVDCRPLSELIPKERLGGLAVFSQALRLVPYIMPDYWTGPRICEDLPGKRFIVCHCHSAAVQEGFTLNHKVWSGSTCRPQNL